MREGEKPASTTIPGKDASASEKPQAEPTPPERTRRPIIFGEVLFDVFPDGSRVLGGAPFNVAWHLAGFGLSPLFISRIGDDEEGEEIVEAMRRFGLGTGGLQADPDHPTGRVNVLFVDGEPSYMIPEGQAWDFVDADSLPDDERLSRFDLVYHGTLALRGAATRAALERLLERRALPRVIDVNLRAPWYRADLVREDVADASLLKVSEGELGELGAGGPAAALHAVAGGDMLARATALRSALRAETLVVTRGAEGSLLVGSEATVHSPAKRREPFVDAVGAGDAFSATLIAGRLFGWGPALTIARAADFAARVCTIRGATTFDRALYDETLEFWRA